MKFFVCFFLTALSGALFADDFINLVRKTSSNYSSSMDVDAMNPGEISFETLLEGQKANLAVSVTHLNSSVFTLVNADTIMKNRKTTPPTINVSDLRFLIDSSENPTEACDGGGVGSSDTSCSGKECNITQRVISACNDSDCWKNSPSTNRELDEVIDEPFSLQTKVDVTACIPNNIPGYKHILMITNTNPSPSDLHGGSVFVNLTLLNDIIE